MFLGKRGIHTAELVEKPSDRKQDLGNARDLVGRYDEAIEHYRQVLRQVSRPASAGKTASDVTRSA